MVATKMADLQKEESKIKLIIEHFKRLKDEVALGSGRKLMVVSVWPLVLPTELIDVYPEWEEYGKLKEFVNMMLERYKDILAVFYKRQVSDRGTTVGQLLDMAEAKGDSCVSKKVSSKAGK
jgi:hypothetical protein